MPSYSSGDRTQARRPASSPARAAPNSKILTKHLVCPLFAAQLWQKKLRIAKASKWADTDIGRGLLTVEGAFAKNAKTETIPLNSRLLKALRGLRRASTREPGYVFTRANGQPFKSVQNIFRKAIRKAGLKGVSPHVRRHTFASRLATAGVDLRTIQRLGRWANLAMVQRYANLSESHLSNAVETLSENSPQLFPTNTETASRKQILKAAVRY